MMRNRTMPRPQIRLDYGKAMADTIGSKHGVTKKQLDEQLTRLPKAIDRLREDPKRRLKEDAYRYLPDDREAVREIKQLVDRIKNRCEIFVVIGIGGSALGSIALQTALRPFMHNLLDDKQRTGPRIFVLDNIDPVQFDSFLAWLGRKRLKKAVFNVISRGGQTAETISRFLIILRRLGQKACKEQVVVTTNSSPDNTLYKIADNEGLEYLKIPDYLVGRFSVLSTVGLFGAAMCGGDEDIDELLKGASDMNERVRIDTNSLLKDTSDMSKRLDVLCKNPAAIIAAVNYCLYNMGKNISVMMPYSYALKDLADWYRQLWAESLGKARDLADREVWVGPTPIRSLGATDQHSQLQLYLEGQNDKLFTFLKVDNFGKDCVIDPAPKCAPEFDFLNHKTLGTLLNNEKVATEYTLLQDNRPCLTIIFPEVSAYTVGQFVYLYEVATSLTGALFGINPYDQPAVELVKEATFALMDKPGRKYEVLADKIRSKTDIDVKFLV